MVDSQWSVWRMHWNFVKRKKEIMSASIDEQRKNSPVNGNAERFTHASYLWDDNVADSMKNDEVALLIYRSNLLGADLRLTNYGGGNTSCKATARDPLTGQTVEAMWVKGSGGDLGTLKKSGL